MKIMGNREEAHFKKKKEKEIEIKINVSLFRNNIEFR